jgi:hypothetical protein
MTSPAKPAEPTPTVANPQLNQDLTGVLCDKEVRLLKSACCEKITETREGIYRLIDVASIVASFALMYFSGFSTAGFYLGLGVGILLEFTLKACYKILKNRDLEYAAQGLDSNGFKQYLISNQLSPSIASLVDIWQKYNLRNRVRAEQVNRM